MRVAAGLLSMVLAAAAAQAGAPAERAKAPAVVAGATSAATGPASASASGRPRRIPTSELAIQPAFSRPVISPDGKRLAGKIVVGGKQAIGIHSFAGDKLRILGMPEKSDLRWYRWAGNNRVLISVAKTVPFFDDEAVMTRLFCLDITTGRTTLMGPRDEGLEGDDLLYVDKGGEWILLSFQKTIFDYPSVARIELATNAMKPVVRQRGDVWQWYADDDGVVRAGVGFTDTSWSMIYRRTATDKFRKIGKAKYDADEAALDVLRFARESDEGYVLSNKESGRYALYRYNFATKQRGALVFKSDTNDVTDFATEVGGKTLTSLRYTDDRDRIVWFDEKMKQHQAAIDAAVKQNENWITSRSADDGAMLVWTGASNDPGRYYLYDAAGGVMFRIYTLNEKLKRSELAPARYVHYKARDGLDIPAYLTLPLGRPPKGLPLVVLPHGGPYYVRDKPDFDPEVQLLANRGYAVLQPNYRGSEGYGKAFYEKGEGQWGRQMQDDLDDGMDWLVKEGIADAKRVCIVGGSYGGYAALWGATRNPERYRCAASFAGVSDLGRQLSYQLDFRINRRYRKDWRKTVQGEPNFNVRKVSPLYTIDRLKVPVLLMHGDADQTVPFKQSRLYDEALRKAGITHEFYTLKDEGHGFSSSANLQNWLDRLDAFLAKYNPAD